MKMIQHRSVLILLLAWLLPALACNFPGPASQERGSISEAFRQTLEAQRTLVTPLVTPPSQPLPGSITPAPGNGTPEAPPPVANPPPANPFPGLRTATPGEPPPALPPVSTPEGNLPPVAYTTRAGDTLLAIARRFGVDPGQIAAPEPLPAVGLLIPGQELAIPNLLGGAIPPSALLPDSEVVYAPSAAAFQVEDYVSKAGGFLSTYGEEIDKERFLGPDIVRRVALETSVNPILLLALLEYRAGWVFGQPESQKRIDFPIGFEAPGSRGLYKELLLAAKELNEGYYGWREGTFLELKFPGGASARLHPELNAGTVAVQNLFALFYRPEGWLDALYGLEGFAALHNWMFGDPWARAATVEPIFSPDLAPPTLELPFLPGERWSLTAGPHRAWASGSPRGALDFAPVTGEPACAVSRAWATAAAPGVVARSAHGALALDLDGDGYEQTGWVLVYMHLADFERAPVGTRVNADDPLGHPSCEGGAATGTHVHLARKYNGEWIPAVGVFPYVLSGWVAETGERPYDGLLIKGDQVVTARPDGSHQSSIMR
jgi:murein DD-endopeptidase MepM/ murein hydrolase activator NlpD